MQMVDNHGEFPSLVSMENGRNTIKNNLPVTFTYVHTNSVQINCCEVFFSCVFPPPH